MLPAPSLGPQLGSKTHMCGCPRKESFKHWYTKIETRLCTRHKITLYRVEFVQLYSCPHGKRSGIFSPALKERQTVSQAPLSWPLPSRYKHETVI